MSLTTLLVIALTISIFLNYMAAQKIKWQEKHNKTILEEKSKMSDKLRLKGIAVDRLAGRIKKAERDFNIRIVG